jgi:hypothetical protein
LWFISLAAAAQTPKTIPTLKEIFFEPKSVFLSGAGESQTLIVTGRYSDGSTRDLTREVNFSSNDTSIAEVNSAGVVTSKAPGMTRVVACLDSTAQGSQAGNSSPLRTAAKVGNGANLSALALVVIRELGGPRKLSFANDIAPIFSRAGCNASGCHGALNGQGGFKLSLFGYDPDADYQAIVKDNSGRRVDLKYPEESLILLKPTFTMRHGGGQVITENSLEYRALHDWVAAGAPQGRTGGPRLEKLFVYPNDQRFLTGPDQKQQLVVVGKYNDGREVDMTRLVRYSSSDETVAMVSQGGLVQPRRSGETNIMVRSLGAVGAARVAVVLRPPLAAHQKMARNNFIDDLVLEKLEKMRIIPSEICTDNEYVRRVYLDLIGTLPAPEEVRAFLRDRSRDKRTRLIDALFKRPEYADFWSLKWGDLLTNSPQFLYNGTAYFQSWLRDAFAHNMPYDRFVRELLTSSGGTYQALPTNFYAAGKKPEDMATFTSQAFLGLSLECARCHDHPSEKWKRDDFLGLAAFFSQVKFKNGARNNERFLYVDPEKEFQHPQTKRVIPARFLGAGNADFRPQEDRRARLAAWLTSPSNPYFARAITNRIWRELMGRGIVEPADDFRITNPPTHEVLLDRLAADFVKDGFDLQHLMKRILMSRTYQLSSRTNETNHDDKTAYSHYHLRRLTAEQLADAISQVSGVPEKYPFFYPGKRAIQLPDPIVDSYFLTIFDRSTRENATCTRKQSASMAQSLNLVSGETINAKLRHDKGILARLIREGKTDKEIAEHFWISTLSRAPSKSELKAAQEGISRGQSRREGLEDFVWALLNSKEFLYNH